MKCINNHEVFGNDFCQECGRRVTWKKCKKCERLLTGEEKFCGNCGTSTKVQNPDEPSDEDSNKE